MKVEEIYDLIINIDKPGQRIKEIIDSNFQNLNSEEKRKLYNKIYSKWYREKNPNYFKKKNQEWREKNLDRMREYMREYYRENKEEINEKTKINRRKRFAEDPKAEKAYKEYQKEYREKHKE